MTRLYIIALLLCYSYSYSQSIKSNQHPFDQVTPEEIQMNTYDKDQDADALILYERGNIEFKQNGSNDIYFVNNVYRKIKIFNTDGYDHATVKVYLYKGDNGEKETIHDLKAVTYNAPYKRTFLSPEKIFRKDLNEKWDEVTFTFPGIEPGSVLEYAYRIQSSFFFNLVGWDFQSDIPKIYSEFKAEIPGFWNYNRHLIGSLPLTTNTSMVKNRCFEISGAIANCEKLTYAMKDIPAFKEDKKYSTAKKNYMSRIKFELSKVNRTDGTTKNFTSTWNDTDKILEKENSVGKQLKLQGYFKKNLPAELFRKKNGLAQAKSIFYHIQKHFQLDHDRHLIYSDVNSKKAFETKHGSVAEINLALINALNAAGFKGRIMLLSTRDNGIPTKKHPVLTDFNYLIGYVKIQEDIYLLDASNKFMKFGQTPFETLNGLGRVLDFEHGSHWYTTTPSLKTSELSEVKLEFDEDGVLAGQIKINSSGYSASDKRMALGSLTEREYLDQLVQENGNIEIYEYSHQKLNNLDSTLTEIISVQYDPVDLESEQLFINPFVFRVTNNPFQLKTRSYPVNFGYGLSYITKTAILIPEGYQLLALPDPVNFNLPNQGGFFRANFSVNGNELLIYSNLRTNYNIYQPDKYTYLKEMFNEIIKTNKSLISLEKTSGT